MTEIYSVDEVLHIDSATSTTGLSPAKAKTLEIGSICNNAIYRHEEGIYVGHSVDVALLNILSSFEMSDFRQVRTNTTQVLSYC